MKPAQDTYRIYDSSLWVDVSPTGLPARALYHRLKNLLCERGFHVGHDPFLKKPNPLSWSWQRCLAVKGDLYCTIEVSGGKIGFEFWQNLVLEEGRPCGRWSFDKRSRMPFLIRMQWQATINAMQTFLKTLGFTFEDTSWQRHQLRGMPSILAHMKESCHTPKDYDPMTHTVSHGYNTQGATGKPIQPGKRYMAYINKRLVIGTAFYNLNNMWWLLPNEQSRPYNVASFELFPPDTSAPRRQRLRPEEARKIVQRAFQTAQTKQQWLLCHKLSQYLAKAA